MRKIKNTSFILLLTASLILACSCKKNDTGGKAEIHVLVSHGSVPIIGTTTLYVKFNATSEPSDPTSNYDLKVKGEIDDNHVHVENMRPGDYYLYAVAYDSITEKPVSGGIATKIKWSERKKLKEVELQVN